jgi:hypothetical protein
MILERPEITAAELERRTGWVLKPEGACKGDRCVPLPGTDPDKLDVLMVAERLRMSLVHDEAHGLYALGPEYGSARFEAAAAPDLTLPDRHGDPFSLASLRGQKVLLIAWASW